VWGRQAQKKVVNATEAKQDPKATHHNTRTSKHLTKSCRGVGRKRAFQKVFRVQSRVVVDTFAGWCGERVGNDGLGSSNLSACVGFLNGSVIVESRRHCT